MLFCDGLVVAITYWKRRNTLICCREN